LKSGLATGGQGAASGRAQLTTENTVRSIRDTKQGGRGRDRRYFRLRGELADIERSYALHEGDNPVGALLANAIVIGERSVSRRHAVVRVRSGAVALEDLASKNGTFINGKRIDRAVAEVGDEVRFGSVRLVLEEVDVADAELAFEVKGAEPVRQQSLESPPTAPLVELAGTSAAPLLAVVDDLVASLLGGTEPHLGQGLHAVLRGLGLTQGLVVEWDGADKPVVLAAAGEISTLVARRDLRELFAGAARGASHTAVLTTSLLEGEPPLVCGVITASPKPPLGLVLVGEFGGRSESGGLLRAAVRLFCYCHAKALPVAVAGGTHESYQLAFPNDYVPGESSGMLALYRQMKPLLGGDIPVLLTGETGVGKEHIAPILHASSRRARGPFVAINCAAIPADLLEAELFGIGRGVATGVTEREGKFELAAGGVLFLDEISDMAPILQAKLLRALQEREVHPVGGRAPVAIDVAVVSATNANPDQLVESGQLRPDLYYRLAGCVLRVPPLRERRVDIPLLVEHFIQRCGLASGKRVRGITVKALAALVEHRWPGNIRELEHEVRHLVSVCPPGQAIDSTLLPARLIAAPRPEVTAAEPLGDDIRLEHHVETLERRLIERALSKAHGNRTRAAQFLGITRNGLALKLERLGVHWSEDEKERG
jgi:DNA-binding NtrC family response regulator